MRFLELVKLRYSARAYLDTPVEEEKLHYILEAARLAPTASNRQPFQLIVIHTANQKESLGRIYHQDFFTQPPVILCVCCLPERAWVRDRVNYAPVDAAIVMDHITLAATDVGLGTCWVAAFNPDVAREVLHIPKDAEPVAFTPLGYPADTPGEKNRKPLEELVRYERW